MERELALIQRAGKVALLKLTVRESEVEPSRLKVGFKATIDDGEGDPISGFVGPEFRLDLN